jgi:hypothetical protein
LLDDDEFSAVFDISKSDIPNVQLVDPRVGGDGMQGR